MARSSTETHNGIERRARAIAAREGGTLRRPVVPGAGDHFPLTFVRTGPRTDLPVLVMPGGPGLASAVPYQGFRRLAARHGLDVLMVEHRGIGLSGRTESGAPLPTEAVTIEHAADDMAAVLDHIGAEQAIVVGSSYGSYLAQGVAVRHPGKVAALVLDSPELSVEDDLVANRAHRRRLLWHGEDPRTARCAELVRRLAAAGEPMADLGHIVQVVHEFAGPEILERLLRARLSGRLGWLWRRLAGLGAGEVEGEGVAYMMEPGPVAGIAYGQLGYALPPDGGPIDAQLIRARSADRRPEYAGEPFDLAAEVPGYAWPTVVVSGERDLRTPRPVARRIVELAPQGVLAPLDRTGHSALDTHQLALLHIIHAAREGTTGRLPDLAPCLSALPRKGASGKLGPILSAMVRATTGPGPAPAGGSARAGRTR